MTIDFAQMITPEARAAEELATRRAGMVCSRLQGRLTLGPQICAHIDALADPSNGQLDALTGDPAASWAMRETILNAATWHRTSPTIDELAWLLGFEPEAMDLMFESAMQISV